MKKFLFLFAFLALMVPAIAQTPEEIVSRMEAEMDKHENDGVIMTVDVKIPILGTMTTTSWMLGEKMRMNARMLGVDIYTWSDGKTKWTYDSKKNEVEIENEDPSNPTEADGDTEMFMGLADGYDLSIKKETDQAWHILCKKSKSNKDKDDPKKVELVISKTTYWPLRLSTSMDGIKLTLRDISFGVTDKQVSFNANDFPGCKIIDKR